MRLELSGSLVRPEPIVIHFGVEPGFLPGLGDIIDFNPVTYINLGYTHFDVICIGGGGGMGGGIDTGNTGTQVRNYGGAGGGGGFHRVRGLLSALPNPCPVIVGVGGDPGTEHVSNPALTTDGTDGGTSSFNDPTCRASGGKGGKRAQSNSLTVTTQAHGGQGGLGNRATAGGGAAGGLAGTPAPGGPGTPGTPGVDGTYNTIIQDIGEGGGGGAGGVGKYGVGAGSSPANAATPGGRGSYNPGDTSVYGPGDLPADDPGSGTSDIIPGGAGGAKASPLNKLPYVYGKSKTSREQGDMGAVIIRLTAE